MLIQKSYELKEFLGIVSLGKGIIGMTKFEKLHNSQVIATWFLIDTLLRSESSKQ